MLINTVEPERPQETIWCLRIACWIPKATNTHSEYVILIAFPLQQWLQKTRLNVMFIPFYGPLGPKHVDRVGTRNVFNKSYSCFMVFLFVRHRITF